MTEKLRSLKDDQLTEFQKTGEMEVCGNKLGPEDVRLIYAFDNASKDAPSKYEAHSDNDVSRSICCLSFI